MRPLKRSERDEPGATLPRHAHRLLGPRGGRAPARGRGSPELATDGHGPPRTRAAPRPGTRVWCAGRLTRERAGVGTWRRPQPRRRSARGANHRHLGQLDTRYPRGLPKKGLIRERNTQQRPLRPPREMADSTALRPWRQGHRKPRWPARPPSSGRVAAGARAPGPPTVQRGLLLRVLVLLGQHDFLCERETRSSGGAPRPPDAGTPGRVRRPAPPALPNNGGPRAELSRRGAHLGVSQRSRCDDGLARPHPQVTPPEGGHPRGGLPAGRAVSSPGSRRGAWAQRGG